MNSFLTKRFVGKYGPLVIKVEYSAIQDNLITFWVPFPDGYPRTRLRRKLYKSQHEHFNIKKGEERLAFCELIFNEKNKNKVGFSLFVFPNQYYPKDVSPTEKKCCRGFGKELLCFALRYIVKHGYINIRNGIMEIEAGGGTCDWTSESELMSLDDAKRFLIAYEDTVREEEPKTSLEIRRLACQIKQNKRLVQYYKSVYGFKVTDDTIATRVLMTAALKTVLRK